jgi:hypothetical protein
MPGEYFHITLRIEDNTGFGSMPAQIFIPEGLKLTYISVTGLQGMLIATPPGYDADTGEIIPIYGPEFAYIGAFATSNNTTPEADLIVYTFEVTEDASEGLTEPIAFAFAGAPGYFPPTDIDGRRLDIKLPGNENGELGRIYITDNKTPMDLPE